MSQQPAVLLLAAALTAGYLAGRGRPARWLSRTALDWADDLGYRRPTVTRRQWRWWAREAVYFPLFVWLLATQPRRTVRAWRTRHDPPTRDPAPMWVSLAPPEEPR